MKRLLVFTTLLFSALCFAHSQGNELERSRIVVGMRTIPVLKEFSQLYPNSFYRLEKQAGRYVIEGRGLLTPYYELVIKIPIADPRSSSVPKQIGSAEIELFKIKQITGERGKPVPEYVIPSTRISTQQWVRLVMAKGDFSQIGIQLEGDIMIRRLDEYRDRLREEAHVGW